MSYEIVTDKEYGYWIIYVLYIILNQSRELNLHPRHRCCQCVRSQGHVCLEDSNENVRLFNLFTAC